MQTGKTKPWVWAGGAVVGVGLFLGMVLPQREINRLTREVAMEKSKTRINESLIDERDNEISGLKINLNDQQVLIEDAKVKIVDLRLQVAKVADLKVELEKIQQENNTIMEIVAARKAVAEALLPPSVPKPFETSDLPSGMKRGSGDALEVFDGRPRSTRAVAVPASAEPEIPEWYPPLKDVVTKQIKDAAKASSDDYRTINYEIERQTEAYSSLVRYYKTGSPFIRKLISKYALQWGSDYRMIVYEVSSQIDAKEKLEKPAKP